MTRVVPQRRPASVDEVAQAALGVSRPTTRAVAGRLMRLMR
ncbi:hypothetical protein [Actinomadura madurae]|nr:hypothetical protein [Actinomadura madurae]